MPRKQHFERRQGNRRVEPKIDHMDSQRQPKFARSSGEIVSDERETRRRRGQRRDGLGERRLSLEEKNEGHHSFRVPPFALEKMKKEGQIFEVVRIDSNGFAEIIERRGEKTGKGLRKADQEPKVP
ncbi:MAG: hypothetical protein NUV67_01385 [archaeon]|nr:hypothetical protein [archaeon]